MTRQNRGAKCDTVTFERSTWRWIIGVVFTILATVSGAAWKVVGAAYQVSGDVQDMRLMIEGRMTRVETRVDEHGRRLDGVEGQLRGGKP